ncbi:glycoside hydrolase family 78 protein [Deinococcus sp. YIM 77859]|uniref:glycoside hydrolase family 78 protein n=1 Tax=Deinococcus sp. YIM 77859 TaxID=1540221 RepID=UPI0009DD3F58|nr:glycoside hydrolase family 78 protein [Deinococcus sp. YIM 77859]
MTQTSLPTEETGPGTASITHLRAERRDDALGVASPTPRLSWRVRSASPGWVQSGYEIECQDEQGTHTSGRIPSPDAVLVPWPFAPLTSRERVQVRVRAWNTEEMPTDWSVPLAVEAGLFHSEDWTAHFVTPEFTEGPAPLLRREFDVRGGLTAARLYITALGVYEAQLNGERVGDHVLAPGWTSYDHRLRYQTFDVTSLLREGRNALGVMLGNGWYRGRLGFSGGQRNIYGDRLALLAQLELRYADGTVDRVVTDEDWRAARGPILSSELYDGECYDARLEPVEWAQPGFDDTAWQAVHIVERDLRTLIAPEGPPVRRTELVAPTSIFQSPSGKTLVDFGQNLVGWVRFTVRGEAGQTVTLRHAEVLEHGELGTRPLRTAQAMDQYTLKGGGEETWEPRFTFHGFRYAEIEGWPGDLSPEDVTAVVVHSDLERTGWFECSDPLVNKLHENVVWGMRGNFLDIPTDCPQRDERLGWTGDIQVFAPTASFLYDVDGFLTSWLGDVAAEQSEEGVPPFIVPNIQGERSMVPAAAWTDAAVIVPWVLYERFGDRDVLARQFASMCAWVDFLDRHCGPARVWDQGFQFGDWLDPTAPPDQPGAAKTDAEIVATAYFARSAGLVSQAAAVLGQEDRARHYAALAAEVRAAFARRYVTPDGRMMSDAVTAYTLALAFDLLPNVAQRVQAGERLAKLVRDGGYRILTGFVGTPLICDALTEAGRADAAYRLLMQRENPSWLYPVTMGATTIWERWDSMLPDGSINPGEMTSFNHYALGAVADWLHRTVAGLAPAGPGYRRMTIRPLPGGGLTSASARHVTPYGEASVAWTISGDTFTLEAVLPPNTSATVILPGEEDMPLEVLSGEHRWERPYRSPQRSLPPLTLGLPLVDLWDDEEALNAVLALAQEKHPPLAAALKPGSGLRKLPLAVVLGFSAENKTLTPDVQAIFDRLNRARGLISA